MIKIGKFADYKKALEAVEKAQKEHPDHKYIKCTGNKYLNVSIHTTQEYLNANWI